MTEKLTIENLRGIRNQLRKNKSPSGIVFSDNPISRSKVLAEFAEIAKRDDKTPSRE